MSTRAEPATTLRRSVLLVDDEETILFALEDYLSAAGWDVATARGRAAAERLLDERSFSAAVVDLRLSVADEGGAEGLELARSIRERRPEARVLVLTAYGSRELEEAAQGLGVVAWLQKPQPLDRLHDRLASLVEGTWLS